MIRRGKQEGWLKLPIPTLRPWAELNGVTFDGVDVGSIPGSPDRGCGVVASRDLKGGEEGPLMVIPRDLVLSLERLELQAKADSRLRELLEALGDYGRTTRGAILVFLLHQATIAHARVTQPVGLLNPFTEYVKFLPEELLPTFWIEAERELLTGTSLKPAIEAKLKSLRNEYEKLRTATEHIPWCAEHWWDEVEGLLSFDDWLQVDAMYRSRALEFPGIGDAMLPCIDMANHAADDATAALYETDRQGNAILLLRDGFSVKEGEEITITYGDQKGACEMIFSYGFLDESMTSGKALFLDLQAQDEDPLGLAKHRVSNVAPGVKLSETAAGTEWHSDFVWIICVNEEDGLAFRMLQTNDGDRELKTYWKEIELQDTSNLKMLLEQDPQWEVYHLRAVAMIQQRVERQLQLLHDTKDVESVDHGHDSGVRERPQHLAMRLRRLESTLLEKAYESLEEQKMALFNTDAVQKYLSSAAQEDATNESVEEEEEEEDFT